MRRVPGGRAAEELRHKADVERLVAEALADFREVAVLARAESAIDGIEIEIAVRPHRSPKALPVGKMAVYAFFLNGQALKVGKVGPKSAARYTRQHYIPGSSRSNLAKSILATPLKVGAGAVDYATIGDWIANRTDRVNLLLPVSYGMPVVSLLEAFLHVRWKPVFEGKADEDPLSAPE